MTSAALELWPRLSEDLPGPRSLYRCQACGLACAPPTREIWQEHDQDDEPEPIVVVLCSSCSSEIVEPHARLYTLLDPNEPIPGALGLCDGCRHQDQRAGLRCAHPAARQNGGEGLSIRIRRPTTAYVCEAAPGGGRRGRALKIWPKQATACSGRVVACGS